MAKTNLTVQLDDGIVRRARVVAAKRGTSVSALVARQLTDLVAEDDRYEQAAARARELLAAAKSHGERTWHRDELHDR
jgi:plasmid stability protein